MEKPDPFTFMDVGAKVYYFIIGWTVVLSGVYVAFYKQPKALDVDHEETRKRIMQTKGTWGSNNSSSWVDNYVIKLGSLRRSSIDVLNQ